MQQVREVSIKRYARLRRAGSRGNQQARRRRAHQLNRIEDYNFCPGLFAQGVDKLANLFGNFLVHN